MYKLSSQWLPTFYIVIVACILLAPAFGASQPISLYRWVDDPHLEAELVEQASERLQQAIAKPEYMLNHWVELPASPDVKIRKVQHLSLREAILLALRYNPNIQNAELDRIIQRYQLRIAYNQFELQYALGAVASTEHSRFSGIGSSTNHTFLASPEGSLETPWGTQLNLKIDNNASINNNYSPVLNFSLNQPLLRGFGTTVNQAGLLDAIDSDQINKIMLNQSVMDQITQVITAYRSLVLSGNNLENQKRQLTEAKKSYQINEKKIEAGQLEPTGNIQPSYQIESLSLMVEQAENEFKNSAQDLLQVIGLDPQMRLAVPNDIPITKIVVPDLKKSIDLALARNTQYLAQQMQVRADKRMFEVAKNQQLWQLDLGANVQSGSVITVDGTGTGFNNFKGLYNGHNLSESARLTLTVPINDVGRRGELISAKVKLEKDQLNLVALRRALITTITNTINTIASQAKRYRLAEKQVKLAAQSYELEKKKLHAGIASSLDVNNTQNQLIQAQAGLIGAKVAYLNQLSALQRLLGTTLEEWQIKLRYGQ